MGVQEEYETARNRRSQAAAARLSGGDSMRSVLALIVGGERIGPDYLGYLIPALTFLIALMSVIALYRRFMKR
jgi:hypothetical protein